MTGAKFVYEQSDAELVDGMQFEAHVSAIHAGARLADFNFDKLWFHRIFTQAGADDRRKVTLSQLAGRNID